MLMKGWKRSKRKRKLSKIRTMKRIEKLSLLRQDSSLRMQSGTRTSECITRVRALSGRQTRKLYKKQRRI